MVWPLRPITKIDIRTAKTKSTRSTQYPAILTMDVAIDAVSMHQRTQEGAGLPNKYVFDDNCDSTTDHLCLRGAVSKNHRFAVEGLTGVLYIF